MSEQAREWVVVYDETNGDITDYMIVPGGRMYRTRCHPSGVCRTVALVFVPGAREEESDD